MTYWARVDSAGCVVELVSSDPGDPSYIAWPVGFDFSAHGRLFWLGGEWLHRPSLPDPVSVEAGETITLTWADLPAGTTYSVTDSEVGYEIAGGPVEDGAVALLFDEPGAYLIEITPPQPFLPVRLRIER